jgi:hypothetical protein
MSRSQTVAQTDGQFERDWLSRFGPQVVARTRALWAAWEKRTAVKSISGSAVASRKREASYRRIPDGWKFRRRVYRRRRLIRREDRDFSGTATPLHWRDRLTTQRGRPLTRAPGHTA